MHFVQRRLGRRGSLLIDRYYCLPATSIVRKVYYGWKSRAYDLAAAFGFVGKDHLEYIGSVSYKSTVHQRLGELMGSLSTSLLMLLLQVS